MSVPAPSAITAFADQLGEDCGGVAPTIEHRGDRRWRVTVANDQVSMWVEYDVLSRGRLQWKNSQLFRNGERVPNASTYGGFLDYFRDPDGTAPPPEIVYTDVDPAEAPESVRRMQQKLELALAKAGVFDIVVRRGTRGVWVVAVVNDRVDLRCRFATPLMDTKRPERIPVPVPAKRFLELTIDGKDLTAEVNGRIDKALAMMTTHTAAPPPPPIAGTRQAAVPTTGVKVRNTVVMRN